ncbi:hypothetical protein [Legionella hackeliae]|uniref:Uncharacterized protein n=1 Tax=Legionella hackeliae TaxID=449 RepID=A0A0A8UPG4_LEGHA|nr:hypothetical protein [Legionella hackeliae]KTD06650.1 hypothetical protein Lhac_3173 [Legionella hackeliae]CEK10770.1 protein of unknown function [Legionella hackeliae]STX47509.1 Uncharacterised protein [Legionella hackeliae]
MKYTPNHFKSPKPISTFKWVMDNCTVRVTTKKQLDFINSIDGQKLMDELFDCKNESKYLKTARIIEDIMESLSTELTPSLGQ